MRLATLRRVTVRSAQITYGREIGLCDSDWLVLAFIGMHERARSAAEIAARLNIDKGQISRIVSRLTDEGLIERDRRRAPLRLTARGREVHAEIYRILDSRNSAVLRGVTAQQRERFDATLDKLFANGCALLEFERGLAVDGDDVGRVVFERPGGGEDGWRPPEPSSSQSLIMPDLHVLFRLLRQSANLAYSRVAGLPEFDYLTITNIAMDGPLTLVDLIAELDRNKSQVGRAVSRLVERGLVSRRKEKGVSSVVLSLTDAGRAAYELIAAEAQRRDDVLIADLTVHEFRNALTVLDRIMDNALKLLADERSGACEAGRRTRTVKT